MTYGEFLMWFFVCYALIMAPFAAPFMIEMVFKIIKGIKIEDIHKDS